jgi:EGF-like domain
MQRLLCSAIIATLFLVTATAQAQECAQDIDCDGNFVCVDGSCQSPPVTVTPVETTPPPSPDSSVNDHCRNVGCSNHGICVSKAGSPVCSCDEGYAPDSSTGLSCLPLPSQPRLPVAAVQSGPSRDDPELLAVEQAIGASRFAQFLFYKRSTLINTKISYVDYELRLARKKRGSGIATLICFPIPVAFGGLMFWVMTDVVHIPVVPIIFMALGSMGSLTMIIVGAAKTGKYSGRMRRLQGVKSGNSARLKFDGISPLLATDRSIAGASIGFRF